jgi:hypothetical protein
MEYAVDTGLYALDSVDYYINISMLFVGFMECICAGWMYKYQEHTDKIGSSAWWTAIGSMILACYYGPRAGLGYGGAEGTLIGFLLGFFIFSVGTFVAVRQAANYQGRPISKDVAADVLLFNVENLRQTFNDAAGSVKGNFNIPILWSYLIKFLIPPILMLFLIMKFTSSSFGQYSGYHTWYQGWGIFVGATPWFATAINWVLPDIWDQLTPEQQPDGDSKLDSITGDSITGDSITGPRILTQDQSTRWCKF